MSATILPVLRCFLLVLDEKAIEDKKKSDTSQETKKVLSFFLKRTSDFSPGQSVGECQKLRSVRLKQIVLGNARSFSCVQQIV